MQALFEAVRRAQRYGQVVLRLKQVCVALALSDVPEAAQDILLVPDGQRGAPA